MEQENNIQETMTPAQRVRSDWQALVDKLSYKAIVQNMPFLIFLAVLCIIYISNSHRANEIQRELNVQNNNLREMRWKYLDSKSQLMYVKTETQVINNARHLGLQPSLLPAYKITVDTIKK
jgi:hypothetical protein